MKALYFLRIDNDPLELARFYKSRAAALQVFRAIAEELAGYGQSCSATIHMAPSISELAEYPDMVLSLGPRGGLRVEVA
jgi:hypothetical protein